MSFTKYRRSQWTLSFVFFFGKISRNAWNKKEGRSRTTCCRVQSRNILSYSALYIQGLGLSLFSSFCIQNKLCASRRAHRLSVTQLSQMCYSPPANCRDQTNTVFNAFLCLSWPRGGLRLVGLTPHARRGAQPLEGSRARALSEIITRT